MTDERSNTALLNVQGNAFAVEFEQVTFPTGEVFFVPAYAQNRPAAKRVLNKSFYEPKTHKLVPKLLEARPGDMVHAGTFFGDMLPTFARASKHRVFAFEPVLENYVLAKICVEQNALDNVFLLNAALGPHVGIVRINTGLSSGKHRGGASEIDDIGQRTSMVTIDSLNLTNLSLIQLDVEGYELNALRGAAQAIERHSPIIMIEDNSNTCADYLHILEYERCGAIPGLTIWARAGDRESVTNLIAAM